MLAMQHLIPGYHSVILLTPRPDSLGTNEHRGWNPGNEASYSCLPTQSPHMHMTLYALPSPQPPSHLLIVVLLNHVGQFGAVLLYVQEADGEGVPLWSNELPGIVEVLQLPLHRESAGQPEGGGKWSRT